MNSRIFGRTGRLVSEVSVLIPGARNPAQAQAHARASVLAPLGADRHVKLAADYEREVAAHIRGPY